MRGEHSLRVVENGCNLDRTSHVLLMLDLTLYTNFNCAPRGSTGVRTNICAPLSDHFYVSVYGVSDSPFTNLSALANNSMTILKTLGKS